MMQSMRARERLENVRIHSPEVREILLDDARDNDTQKLVCVTTYNTCGRGMSVKFFSFFLVVKPIAC